jgi:hypothetical protein
VSAKKVPERPEIHLYVCTLSETWLVWLVWADEVKDK